MGFGILFLGFFIAYVGSFTTLSVFTYVLGAGFIVYSFKKLIFENKMFLCTAILACALELVSIAVVIIYVVGNESINTFLILQNIQSILSIAVGVSLTIAVYIISRSVLLTKIQAWAIINLVFIIVYAICSIFFSFSGSDFAIQRLGLICIISKILYIGFSLIMIFSCYMRICYEGDENMDGKTAFVPFRFLNDKLNGAIKGKDDLNGKRGRKK